MKKAKATKKSIGRPVDFQGCGGFGVINGRVEAVGNGFVTLRYWFARGADGECVASEEGFTAYLSQSDNRIIEIY